MKTLQAYVERKNKWEQLFGKGPLSLESAADRKRIAGMTDAELSPENLSCDGELHPSVVRERHAFLTRAARELMSIDSTVSFYEFS